MLLRLLFSCCKSSRKHADEERFESMTNPSRAQHEQVYETSPLTDDDQVRVIHLHAGQGDEQIECTLQAVDLQDVQWQLKSDHETNPLSYQALSYVWGDPTATLPILCSGHIIDVTRNLHAALKRLRLPDRRRILWVDALCINQRDAEERSRQVQRLRGIYAGASHVIVWLGETDTEEPFRDVGMVLQKMTQGPEAALFELPEDIDAGAFMSFFSNTWFGRKWTFQEFVLARRSVKLCYGRHEINLWLRQHDMQSQQEHEAITNSIVVSGLWTDATLLVAQESSESEETGMDHVGALLKFWVETHVHKKTWSLSSLLHRTSGYRTTLMADHIIAILGLASDLTEAERRSLIDYAISPGNLILRTARLLLMKEGPGCLMNAIGHDVSWASQNIDQAGLVPSWVPRYLFKIAREDMVRFPAETRSTSELPLLNGDQLVLHGRMANKVSASGAHSSAATGTNIRSVRQRLRDWHHILKQENDFEQFWKLLVLASNKAFELPQDEPLTRMALDRALQIDEHDIQSLHTESLEGLIWSCAVEFAQYMLFKTEDGGLGFGTHKLQPGDHIFCYGEHEENTFILREKRNGEYSIIGNACVVIREGGSIPHKAASCSDVAIT